MAFLHLKAAFTPRVCFKASSWGIIQPALVYTHFIDKVPAFIRRKRNGTLDQIGREEATLDE